MNNALLENTAQIENQNLTSIKTPHLKVVKEVQKNNPSTNSENSQLSVNLKRGKGVSKKTEEPWLDIHGRKKSDDLLKIECHSWSFEQWEKYLRTLEFNEDENVVTSQNMDLIDLEDFASMVGDSEFIDENCLLLGSLEDARKKLTSKQWKVLELLYVESLNCVEAAEVIGTSKQNISKIKQRALTTLMNTMKEHSITRKRLTKARLSD